MKTVKSSVHETFKAPEFVDLTKLLVKKLEAEDKMRDAQTELRQVDVQMNLLEARHGIGKYQRLGRRWQNPFYAISWVHFWQLIICRL
jgi:hypothetical protein